MKLSELFSYLTYGELANLKVGGKDDGGIHPKYSAEVTSYITRGLTALHTRFNVKHSEVMVQQFEEVTEYILRPEYAESNPEETTHHKWIMDSPYRPFLGDILRIDSVFNEVGEEIPLNDAGCVCSVFTNQHDVLQMPYPIADNAVSILYTADHAPIDLSSKDPKDIDIEIPPYLVQPLVLYVASLAHTSVGSPEGAQTGLTKMQEYEALCVNLDIQGAAHVEHNTIDKIWRDGWV